MNQAGGATKWLGNGTCSAPLSCSATAPAPCSNNPSLTCITVTVSYDWKSPSAILPALPFVPQPGPISSSSTVSLAGP
jgi:hypothetical protein